MSYSGLYKPLHKANSLYKPISVQLSPVLLTEIITSSTNRSNLPLPEYSAQKAHTLHSLLSLTTSAKQYSTSNRL